jgi:hypothetical protein
MVITEDMLDVKRSGRGSKEIFKNSCRKGKNINMDEIITKEAIE